MIVIFVVVVVVVVVMISVTGLTGIRAGVERKSVTEGLRLSSGGWCRRHR